MKIFSLIIASLIFFTGFSQEKKDSTEVMQSIAHPEHPAEFPGGNAQWIKYLERNMNREIAHKYLSIPKGEKFVKQTVQLLFEIGTEGQTMHIVVENLADIHPAIAKEAVRIITESPKWKPASQDGKPVTDQRRQKLSFMWSNSF